MSSTPTCVWRFLSFHLKKANWAVCSEVQPCRPFSAIKDLLELLAHLLTMITKFLGPGGTRAFFADSLLMKQQLVVINRSR